MNIKIVEDKGQQPNQINASVQNIGQTSLTTDSDTIPIYYVIIGCGTAAVVNHTTLRQTEWGKKRIGELPVMHIGFNDPWSEYFEHGMGQPPSLLTMPGYHRRPSQSTDVFAHNPGCSSKKFAVCTKREWELLRAKYHKEKQKTSKFHHKEGWVAVIQKKTALMSEKVQAVIADLKKNENIDLTETNINKKLEEKFPSDEPNYRLVVLVPESEDECRLEFVYAQKIDICTGAGRAQNRFEVKKFDNDNANKIGRTKLCVPPRLWNEKSKKRRVVTGPEALMTATAWNKTDRVYVNGGGGIGLNMVERGEGEGCHIDWAARSLAASFNLPRNDTVLRHPGSSYNVNTAAKESLALYLEKKMGGAPEISVLIVSWLKSRKFGDRENLRSELLVKRSEVIANRGSGAEFFGQIANSVEIMNALDPSKGARLKAGESGVREGVFFAPTNEKFVLTPSDGRWRFGKGCDLDIVKVEDDKVTVKIKSSNRNGNIGTPEIRDYFEQNAAHNDKGAFALSDDYKDVWKGIAQLNENEGGVYHRVCVTTGLGTEDLGEPSSTAADFSFVVLTENGRTVGLQSEGGSVRILGAAAQVHPTLLFVLDAKKTTDATSVYFNSLPMSAVPPGFIFTGINVALANHYFDDLTPNCNVNVMSVDELKKWISEKHSAFKEPEALALAVVKHRRFNNGYENRAAIKGFLQSEESLKNAPGWEAIVDNLETNYPPARDFLD